MSRIRHNIVWNLLLRRCYFIAFSSCYILYISSYPDVEGAEGGGWSFRLYPLRLRRNLSLDSQEDEEKE